MVLAKGRALSQAEPFDVLRQLAEACASLEAGPIEHAARAVLDLVARPLEPGVSAEVRWQSLFECGISPLDALTMRPAVVIVEDLHWCDASSQELIERFGKSLGGRHGLLIVTTRPGAPVASTTTIELTPMSNDEIRGLVLANSPHDLSEATVETTVASAEGVPHPGVHRGVAGQIRQALHDPSEPSGCDGVGHRALAYAGVPGVGNARYARSREEAEVAVTVFNIHAGNRA